MNRRARKADGLVDVMLRLWVETRLEMRYKFYVFPADPMPAEWRSQEWFAEVPLDSDESLYISWKSVLFQESTKVSCGITGKRENGSQRRESDD